MRSFPVWLCVYSRGTSLVCEVLGIVNEQLDLIPRENVWELPQDYEPVVPARI